MYEKNTNKSNGPKIIASIATFDPTNRNEFGCSCRRTLINRSRYSYLQDSREVYGLLKKYEKLRICLIRLQ